MQRTQQSYNYLLHRFETLFGDRPVVSIGPEEIYQFLDGLTEQSSKSTRRLRYAQVKASYNVTIENCCLNIKNPCSAPILSKSFKMPKQKARKILDKETVDEIIYNAKCLRDRLIMELQARCGLRIGEVLNLRVKDISDRKLTLQGPKSGKDEEVAFMPEQVAKRQIQGKLWELRSIDDIIKGHERDHEFKALLDQARLRVAIARQIKLARQKAGLTQAELAKALGVAQPMIGRLESLKDKRLPSLELLAKIAAVTKKRLVVDQPKLHLELAAR